MLDVSVQKRAEELLREQEEQYRFLVNTVPVIVWSSKPDGTTDYQNDRWYEYTGLSRSENPDRWADIVHPDDAERVVREWREAVETGEPFRTEFRLRRGSDSEYRWWQTEALPMVDRHGKITRWFGTCSDIHDRLMAEQELQEIDKRKDEFIATLAHELRNPLAPIRMAVQVFKKKSDLVPDLSLSRDIIDRQVVQMARLLDDLLDVSRIARGKLELRKERSLLKDLVDTAIETSRPLIDAGGHHLHVELPVEPIFVMGDRVRLAQVFSNLLNNAAKYTDRGGSIRLSVAAQNGEVSTSISDNGIGISGDVLPHLFEMFAQATPTLERAQGGLGIGLALVKVFVELHGGKVEAKSDGSMKGSTFTVRLPIDVGTSERIAESAARAV